MAQMIPSQLPEDTKSYGEREFYRCLAEMPNTDDWVVLHSIHLARVNRKPQSEADFVVLIPDGGIFVVEVKGGEISFEDGEWWTTSRNGDSNKIHPVNQATECMNALYDFIAKESRASEGSKKCIWGWCVAFPDSDFHTKNAIPDLADEQVADRTDLVDLRAFFLRLADFWKKRLMGMPGRKCALTAAECGEIVKRLRPNIHYTVSLSGQVTTIEQQLIRFTEEQKDVFEGLCENDRCLVKGEAGTGKTVLAQNFYTSVVQAGASCAYFCYNERLAADIRRSIHSKTDCRFLSYLESLVKPVFPEIEVEKEKDRSEYYLHVLPKYFLNLPEGSYEPFDYLIVDEAQDLMTEEYLDVFDRLLCGGLENGRWMFFIDAEHQSIYTQKTYEEIYQLLEYYCRYYTKYTLRLNCRNSAAIVDKINRWFGLQVRCRDSLERGKEVQVEQYRRSEEEVEALEKILDKLSAEKIALEDIVILSPNRLENSAAAEVKAHKISVDRGEGAIYFSTVQAFKGLESKVIVLCGISDLSVERIRQYLYIGMTRAKGLLYIVMHKRAYARLNQ